MSESNNTELQQVLNVINSRFERLDSRFERLESEMSEFKKDTAVNFAQVNTKLDSLTQEVDIKVEAAKDVLSSKSDTLSQLVKGKEETFDAKTAGLDRRLILQERLNFGVLGALLVTLIINVIKII